MHETQPMAGLMNDWLGPLIEQELRCAVEWKRRPSALHEKESSDSKPNGAPDVEPDAVSGRLKKSIKFPYDDDGSNLRSRKHFPQHSKRAVQVHQLIGRKHPYSCVLSDGYTFVPAKFSSGAINKRQREIGQDMSQVQTGVVLNIPEFEISATVIGSPFIRLLITAFDLLHPRPEPQFGHPQPVDARPVTQESLKKLSILRNGQDRTSAAAEEISDHEEQTLIASQGRGGMRPSNIEDFATQIDHDVTMYQGLNIAPPVRPPRNDNRIRHNDPPSNILGTKADMDYLEAKKAQRMIQRETPNPLDVLMALHNGPSPNNKPQRPAFAANSETTTSDRRKSSTIFTRNDNPSSPLSSSQIRLGSQADPNVLDEDDIEDVKPPEAEVSAEEHTDALQADRTCPFTIGDEELHIQPQMPISMEKATPIPEPTKASLAKPLGSPNNISDPWANVPRLTRSICIVPKEQQALLARPESWNPRSDSKPFPVPNVPRTLLEALLRAGERGPVQSGTVVQTLASSQHSEGLPDNRTNTNVQKDRVKRLNKSHDLTDSDQSSSSESGFGGRLAGARDAVRRGSMAEYISSSQHSIPAATNNTGKIIVGQDARLEKSYDNASPDLSSASDSSSEDEPFDWPASSPRGGITDGLPPDSSGPRAPSESPQKLRVEVARSDVPHTQSSGQIATDESDTSILHQTPQLHNPVSSSTPTTSVIFPTAVQPLVTPRSNSSHRPTQSSTKSLTLASSIMRPFAAICQERDVVMKDLDYTSPAKAVQSFGTNVQIPSSLTRLVPSTLPPSKHLIRTGLMDGTNDSDVPSEVNAALVDQQIQDDLFRASTQSAQTYTPSRSGADILSSPASNVASSPPVSSASPSNKKMQSSRFGFSQDPQVLDPPNDHGKARRDFLKQASNKKMGFVPTDPKAMARGANSTPKRPKAMTHVSKDTPMGPKAVTTQLKSTPDWPKVTSRVSKAILKSTAPEVARTRSRSHEKPKTKRSRSPHDSEPEDLNFCIAFWKGGSCRDPRTCPYMHERDPSKAAASKGIASMTKATKHNVPITAISGIASKMTTTKGANSTAAAPTSAALAPMANVIPPKQLVSIETIDKQDWNKVVVEPHTSGPTEAVITLPITLPSQASYNPARPPNPAISSAGRVFEDFTKAYPSYKDNKGRIDHFINICSMMRKLEKDGGLHPSLYDDFMLRHKTHYMPYCTQSLEDGVNPLPYEKYFQEILAAESRRHNIITPSILRFLVPVVNNESVSKTTAEGDGSRRSSVEDITAAFTTVLSTYGPPPRQSDSRFREASPQYRRRNPRNYRARSPAPTRRNRSPEPRRRWYPEPRRNWSREPRRIWSPEPRHSERRQARRSRSPERSLESRIERCSRSPERRQRECAPSSATRHNKNQSWWEDESTPMKNFNRSFQATKTFQADLKNSDTKNRLSVLEWDL